MRKCATTECRPGGWAGRFIPRSWRMLARVGKGTDEDLQRALVGHEFAHGVAREKNCKNPKRRGECAYIGQHDHKYFYPTLARVHRIMGTKPEAARALEAGSGYSPPPGWMQPKARRSKRRISGLPMHAKRAATPTSPRRKHKAKTITRRRSITGLRR